MNSVVLAASTFDDFVQALIQGIPVGAVYALIAVGFVLTYKTSGVFNLAFGAQAYISAAMYFKLHTAGTGPSGRRCSCRSSSWPRRSASCSNG